MPCNQEKADTRLKGFEKVRIILVDTDVVGVGVVVVVIIALYHYFDLQIGELWVESGVGNIIDGCQYKSTLRFCE